MTAAEIIERFDEDRKNTIRPETKLRWLEELERIVIDETIRTHKLPEELKEVEWDTYFDDWGMDSNMLVPQPWDDVYIHWLDRKMAWMQKEPKAMNVANTLYDNAMLSYTGWYNRHHMPLRAFVPWTRHDTI